MNEYVGWFSFGILLLGIVRLLLDIVGKNKIKQWVIALIKSSLDVIKFITDKEKRQQLKNDLVRVNETIKPYIINRTALKSLLFLDYVIFFLGTALCLIYLDRIAISHNIYLAAFMAIALMAANINLLRRAVLLYKALQKSLV